MAKCLFFSYSETVWYLYEAPQEQGNTFILFSYFVRKVRKHVDKFLIPASYVVLYLSTSTYEKAVVSSISTTISRLSNKFEFLNFSRISRLVSTLYKLFKKLNLQFFQNIVTTSPLSNYNPTCRTFGIPWLFQDFHNFQADEHPVWTLLQEL